MHPNSLANLQPAFRPGSIGNPEGHNQYTYREDCEKVFAGLAVDGMEAVLQALFLKAAGGSDKHIRLILERAFPAIAKVDVDIGGADVAGLGAELASRAAKRRARIGAGETDDASTDGSV